jgi:hypothetical protein
MEELQNRLREDWEHIQEDRKEHRRLVIAAPPCWKHQWMVVVAK